MSSSDPRHASSPTSYSGAATGLRPDAQLAYAAIKMAVASRGGVQAINGPNWRIDPSPRAIFRTDRDSTYTATAFTKLCGRLGIRQPMGRVGSCFDNAAEAFSSSLEWEVLSRNEFHSTGQAPGRRTRLVQQALQPSAPTQLGCHDEPG